LPVFRDELRREFAKMFYEAETVVHCVALAAVVRLSCAAFMRGF
jgi:hypothetical protein